MRSMAYIPTELLVEILKRLPWTSRRRLRLVCRTWRDLVHERTTEMQQCRDAVPLVVTTESVYLLHDLDYSSKNCRARELWRPSDTTDVYKQKEVVGVCNGVLCLCDNAKPGGAITLANPATGDVLELPHIPCAGIFRRHNTRRSGRNWHQAYSFGYNHTTGQYKVVHVPFFFKLKDALHVFTLGEASWKQIPAPDAKCKLEAGLVSANGATYWVTEGSERIMSFDHESEQVTCTKPLPKSAGASRPICEYLTEVHRRLSVTVASRVDVSKPCPPHYGRDLPTIEVWILDNTTWVHQYTLLSPAVHLARPNFIHGNYVLTVMPAGEKGQKMFQYRLQGPKYYHHVKKPESHALHIKDCHYYGAFSYIRGDVCQVFAYIKTTETLGVY